MFTLVVGVIVAVLGIMLGFVSSSDLAGTMVVVGFAMVCVGIDLRRIRKAVAPASPPVARVSPFRPPPEEEG